MIDDAFNNWDKKSSAWEEHKGNHVQIDLRSGQTYFGMLSESAQEGVTINPILKKSPQTGAYVEANGPVFYDSMDVSAVIPLDENDYVSLQRLHP